MTRTIAPMPDVTPPPPARAGRPVPFERDAALVLGAMQNALHDLFKTVPGGVRKQADIEKTFALDRKLCWQIFRISSASNPLAAGTNVPARTSVDRLLKAASRRRLPAPVIERLSAAFDDFERLVGEHAGDRQEFDSLLAAALPEEQDKMLQTSREAMFEAARNVRGVATETYSSTNLFHPAASAPDMLDGANLITNLGLRRIRRGAHVEHMMQNATSRAGVTTIDGRPINGFADVMLERFCSDPPPEVTARRAGAESELTRYMLEGDDVGVTAGVDAVIADFVPALRSRYGTATRPFVGAASWPDVPARSQVLDILLYDGVVPRQEPHVAVYDMVPYGRLTRFPDPDRDGDRVPFQPVARYMGMGIDAFRCSHIPRYEEMLALICEKRGWDGSKFHGYRLEIEYPIYSWETVLVLRLPPAPGG